MTCPKLLPAAHPGVRGPVIIAVLDGVGLGRGDEADAVAAARTPTLARLRREALTMSLSAHGSAVGMPSDDDMGNSEVGHNVIGAGRVFDQGAKLVQQAIDSGEIFNTPLFGDIVHAAKRDSTPVHLLGLLSDGNVHSHIDHLLAILRRLDAEGVTEVYVHALLDGRDVPKTSAHLYAAELERVLASINSKPSRRYRVASGGGRMVITMDRYEADWPMVARGWDTHVRGVGRGFGSLLEAIATLRTEHPDITDQELPPFVIVDSGVPVGRIERGAVIAWNFRGDRMLEIVRAFEDEVFDKFERGAKPNVRFVGMTLYDGDTQRPKNYLVAPPTIRCTLGELLANAGVTQLAVSETQKFGHVTYFWNGNKSGAFDPTRERYIEIPSWPQPFDAHPEMRAAEITTAVLNELDNGSYGLVRLNYANGDMVGHTGNFAATVAAIEAVDAALAPLVAYIELRGGALVVTADHGNAEDMAERDKKTQAILRDEQGRIVAKTSHSLNPVPLHIFLPKAERERFSLQEVKTPGLGNIAATLATLLGFEPPADYLPSVLGPRA